MTVCDFINILIRLGSNWWSLWTGERGKFMTFISDDKRLTFTRCIPCYKAFG